MDGARRVLEMVLANPHGIEILSLRMQHYTSCRHPVLREDGSLTFEWNDAEAARMDADLTTLFRQIEARIIQSMGIPIPPTISEEANP
jgi:hypothetical protein